MTIIERIEEDSKAALKEGAKLKRSVLNDLLNRTKKIGKDENPPRESTDADVVTAVKKMLSGLEETRSFLVKGNVPVEDERYATLDSEKAVLEVYLPQQMSEEAIAAALQGQPKNKGACMAYLKQNFAGTYDGKLAAQIVDRFIAA